MKKQNLRRFLNDALLAAPLLTTILKREVYGTGLKCSLLILPLVTALALPSLSGAAITIESTRRLAQAYVSVSYPQDGAYQYAESLVPGAFSGSFAVSKTASNPPSSASATGSQSSQISTDGAKLLISGNGSTSTTCSTPIVYDSAQGSSLIDVFFNVSEPCRFTLDLRSTGHTAFRLQNFTYPYYYGLNDNGVTSFDITPGRYEFYLLASTQDGSFSPLPLGIGSSSFTVNLSVVTDVFPGNPNEWSDNDADGAGDNADPDDDNDGVPDTEDAIPLDPSESVDTDGDGTGNNADADDDNDGVLDAHDAFPLDPTRSVAAVRNVTLTDLGTFGRNSSARYINPSGEVIGYSELPPPGGSHAFIWDTAYGMRDLETLVGGRRLSGVAGINASGQVAGTFVTPAGFDHAFIWDAARGMRDLGTLGGLASSATGINALGQVVGSANTPFFGRHAFIWDETHGMQDLGTLGGDAIYSIANAVNNAGQVVGECYDGSSQHRAFVWDAAAGMQELGAAGGGRTATRINEAGHVIGYTTGNTYHAFFWDPASGIHDLGTLGGPVSYPSGISDSGQVVGYADTAEYIPPDGSGNDEGGYIHHAFIWDLTHGMQDLNLGTANRHSVAQGIDAFGQVIGSVADFGAVLWVPGEGVQPLGINHASAMNDAGQIVGFGFGPDRQHAYLVSVDSIPNPDAPVIAGISPASAESGAGALELAIDGTGFVDGTTVFWGGHELIPSSLTATALQVTVPAALLETSADLEAISVSVLTPGGDQSNSLGFSIVRHADQVAVVESAIVTAGESAGVSIAPGSDTGSGIAATLIHAGAGDASLSAAVYNEDPSPEGASFEIAGEFMDLNVGGATLNDVMDAFFYYSADAANATLKFYNQSTGSWENVSPAINNPGQSRFEVRFSATSHPKITELTGTFFATAITDQERPVIVCADVTVPCSVEPLVAVSYPAPTSLSDDIDSPSQISVVYSIASGSGFPVGVTTVTCTATDRSGNAASTTFTVTREALGFTGFLAPLGGADVSGGSSDSPLRTFKAGSTIPVKFAATCNGSPVLTGVHKLQVVKFSNATLAGTPIDASPQDAATTGNGFRLVDGVWHFNLDTMTTGVTTGIWQIRCTMSDGSTHNCWIQIK